MKTLVFVLLALMLPAALNAQSCTACGGAANYDVVYDPTGLTVDVANCKLSLKDFGIVDPGLKKSYTIRLSNCKTTARSITPTVDYIPAGSNTSWDFSSLLDIISAPNNDFPLAGSAVLTPFEVSFKPTGITMGPHTATLTLIVEDTDFTTVTYVMTFTADCSVVSLSTVLVVDRSGSMSDPAYTGATIPKIEALQQAVSLFYAALRPEDRVGVVKYNSNAEPYLPIANRPADLMANYPDELKLPAISNSAQLRPTGSTAIGKGLQLGLTTLAPETPASNRKKVIILQTDGIENVFNPAAADVGIPSDHQIYTVGLGNDVQAQALRDLSTSGPLGFYQVLSEPNADMALSKFYLRILASAKDDAMVNDPVVDVDLNSADTTIAFTSTITSSDIEADFLILDRPELRNLYNVHLINPRGDVITAASVVGGEPVKVFQMFNYTHYRVNGRKITAADSTSFIGTWKVLVVVKDGCSVNERVKSCSAPFGYMCTAKSNLKLTPTALSETYLPGAPITLTANLTESLIPLLNANVDVHVKAPNKQRYHLKLNDNGLDNDRVKGDGIFTGTFYDTGLGGVYEFYFASLLKNKNKELTTRQDIRYVSVGFPRKAPGAGQDAGCELCWWHWAVLIVLALLALYVIIRRI